MITRDSILECADKYGVDATYVAAIYERMCKAHVTCDESTLDFIVSTTLFSPKTHLEILRGYQMCESRIKHLMNTAAYKSISVLRKVWFENKLEFFESALSAISRGDSYTITQQDAFSEIQNTLGEIIAVYESYENELNNAGGKLTWL